MPYDSLEEHRQKKTFTQKAAGVLFGDTARWAVSLATKAGIALLVAWGAMTGVGRLARNNEISNDIEGTVSRSVDLYTKKNPASAQNAFTIAVSGIRDIYPDSRRIELDREKFEEIRNAYNKYATAAKEWKNTVRPVMRSIREGDKALADVAERYAVTIMPSEPATAFPAMTVNIAPETGRWQAAVTISGNWTPEKNAQAVKQLLQALAEQESWKEDLGGVYKIALSPGSPDMTAVLPGEAVSAPAPRQPAPQP